MTSILLLFAALLMAASIGRRILMLVGVKFEYRLDRLVYSSAIGLGTVAYIVLALGLLGFLTVWPVVAALVGTLLLCWNGLLETLLDLQPLARQATAGEPTDSAVRAPAWIFAAGFALVLLAAIALINCFSPPASHEWDALSYHLAAPKVYLQHQRILFLPTDHHSNFPFLVEMLYTLGLLFQGYALANLFHFALGVLTVGGLFAVGRRFGPSGGIVAALAFASTPIVLWESGAAYIELGLALYVLLAFGAALRFRDTDEPRWLLVSGILMGFALAVKALALVPFVLLGALIIIGGYRFKSLRWYLGAAVLVGSPFYVKTAIVTGNPVYPFAYRMFGGRYWSQELADAYSSTQGGFGIQKSTLSAAEDLSGIRPDAESPSIAHRFRNLILAPFALISVPRIFYDYQDPGVFSQLGFLFLALPIVALVVGVSGPGVRWLGGAAFGWYVVWSQSMQYTRYLIPIVPLLLLVGGAGIERVLRGPKPLRWVVCAAIALQPILALAYFVPLLAANPGGLPGGIELATSDAARQAYLKRRLNHYAAIDWLNSSTPKDSGVVLFEEARGFYLDRPYIWGNSLHSTYIPYASFAGGREMAEWFLRHGIRYAIVNLQFTADANTADGHQELRQAAATGTLGQLFLQWYDPKRGGERFRELLGDAVLNGSAAFVSEATQLGVVVLEFRSGASQ